MVHRSTGSLPLDWIGMIERGGESCFLRRVSQTKIMLLRCNIVDDILSVI